MRLAFSSPRLAAACATVLVCSGWRAGNAQSISAGTADPVRISLDYAGSQPGAGSDTPYVTANGQFVTFMSLAPLAFTDTNPYYDIYLIDLASFSSPELITVSLSGAAGNQQSNSEAHASEDGRFVSFCSVANDLVPNDNNNAWDAFVRDRVLGVTILCSQSTTGVQGDSWPFCGMSSDGRFVVFGSNTSVLVPGDTNGQPDMFVRDLITGTTERVSVNSAGVQANGGSGALLPVDISADGRFVSFLSAATNLAPGDTNSSFDVFVRDRALGLTVAASVDGNGQYGNGHSWAGHLSKDGRFVVFTSDATNLVGTDTNAARDVFVRDLVAGTTERVNVDSSGVEANSGASLYPTISPDGRFVGFDSGATNLVPGDTNGSYDAFVRDRLAQRTKRVGLKAGELQCNGHLGLPSISRDARVVVFSGDATDTVPGDTNGVSDVFVRRWPEPATYCTAKTNSLGCVGAISSSGVPMASFPQGFEISASQLLNQKLVVLLYSTSASASLPFQGGTLCLHPPVRRTPKQSTGGSPTGTDCTGHASFDFCSWIASGSDPALAVGRQVWTQFWSRDPGFAPPDNANLTDALTFEIEP